MNRNEIQKHFKVGGEKIKGKNDKHLRIAIDKVTKAVRRVKPSNWTYDSKEIFYKKYPDLIYIVEKNKKQKKKKEKEIKQKISPPPKNKKQKKNISTFDLIANLVKNANIANTSEDNNIKSNIKTEVKEEENVSQKKFFRTNLKGNNGIKKKKKLFKKKVSKNKNKDEKKIIVREFNHDEFKMTQYIDENNNIWNDKHKLIGRFDETENTIMCI